MSATKTSEKVLRDIRPEEDENLFDSFLRGGAKKPQPAPKPTPAKKKSAKPPNTAKAAKPLEPVVENQQQATSVPEIFEHPPEENLKSAESEKGAADKKDAATEPATAPQEDATPKKPRYRDKPATAEEELEAAMNSGNFLAWVTNGKEDDFGHAQNHLFGIKK